MRVLGRILVLLSILPVALWGAGAIWSALAAWRGEGGTAPAARPAEKLRPVPTYVLGDNRWTVFPLAGRQPGIRLVSHADVVPEEGVRPEWGWRYSLEYEVLDGGGEVIDAGAPHYQAGLPEFTDQTEAVASYLGAATLPTFRSTTSIALEDLPEDAAAIRLRAGATDEGVEAVNARIYAPEAVAQRELAVAWQRMSARDRRRLAAGNIYPPQLLSEEEKANLLRWRWRPVGPRGVEGQDYQLKRLYVPVEEGVEEGLPLGGEG